MRATRDLLRRRRSLRRTRAELLTHVQHTHSQENVPEIGTHIAYKANRQGVAERLREPAVQQSIAGDLALIASSDRLRSALECTMVRTATPHDATTVDRRPSVPGIGTILALVLLDKMHDIDRFPSVQDCVSYGRLGTCARASAGKRYGTAGPTMGHASLTWAFSEAAVLCLRANPPGQTSLARLEKQHGTGQALTVLAQKLARAVYSLLKRATACEMHTFFHGEGSGAGEPDASLALNGPSLATRSAMLA